MHDVVSYNAASPFLEFGEGAGDAISPFGDDRTAFELSLNMPLVYFQMERTELFVSYYDVFR